MSVRTLVAVALLGCLAPGGAGCHGTPEARPEDRPGTPPPAPAPAPDRAAAPAPEAEQSRAADADLARYVTQARADLSDGKVGAINAVMRLSAEESKTFWPIYADYEEELFALGDRRVALIREILEGLAREDIDGPKAQRLAEEFLRFEEDRVALLKKYHGIIAKDVSPLRAAQFLKLEHRFATVIDLVIAANMPLLGVRRAGR